MEWNRFADEHNGPEVGDAAIESCTICLSINVVVVRKSKRTQSHIYQAVN